MVLVWFDLELYFVELGSGDLDGLVKFISVALIVSTFSCFVIVFFNTSLNNHNEQIPIPKILP